MTDNVSLIPKFVSLNNSMVLFKFNEEDLEYYTVEAVRQCYYYIGAPEFYEIWDNFNDILIQSGKREFYMQGAPISKGWIREDTLEHLLDTLRIEYISFDKKVHNECQNIIMWEWMVNKDYGLGQQLGTGENNIIMLPEFHGE